MMKTILRTMSILGLACAGLSPVMAQSGVSLEADVKVVRSVEENGATRETYEEPERVLPGDRLLFTTSFANDGAEPVENFVITNPVPGAVALAESGAFVVSVDGGTSFGPLAELSVAQEDGSSRPAALADVTHLRWTIPAVAPGDTGEVQYFAFVR